MIAAKYKKAVLSDATLVGEVPWGELKAIAMEPDYANQIWFVSIT